MSAALAARKRPAPKKATAAKKPGELKAGQLSVDRRLTPNITTVMLPPRTAHHETSPSLEFRWECLRVNAPHIRLDSTTRAAY
jgi:hypothetical protein